MLEHNVTLEFIKQAQHGDDMAKTQLIEHNTPLVKSIIKRYRSKHIEYDDLMQLGNLGLIKAINNFNADYGVKFSTYAVPMITGEIKRFIRDDGSVKVSRAVKLLSCKISGFIEAYSKENSADPTIDVIAKEFNIEPGEVVYIMDSAKFPLSLYDKYDDDSGKNLIDKIGAPETADDMVDRLVLKDCIKALPQREKMVIILRYYKDKTQSEIAKILGVSQVQVSRLESKIIEKIKSQLIS